MVQARASIRDDGPSLSQVSGMAQCGQSAAKHAMNRKSAPGRTTPGTSRTRAEMRGGRKRHHDRKWETSHPRIHRGRDSRPSCQIMSDALISTATLAGPQQEVDCLPHIPVWSCTPFNTEIFIHYKPQIAVAILDLQWMKITCSKFVIAIDSLDIYWRLKVYVDFCGMKMNSTLYYAVHHMIKLQMVFVQVINALKYFFILLK